MPRLYLVRHGEAAAGFDGHLDPGLSARGRDQAEAAAARLAALAPMDLVTSPLARARETAQALERRWGRTARVDPAFSEIPSPTSDLAERVAWLRRLMAGTWDEAEASIRAWRDDVVKALVALPADTVIFTHFVAINVALGAAKGDRRTTCFQPDNASVTILDQGPDGLILVSAGAERQTFVG